MAYRIEISAGELLDRLTILRLKAARVPAAARARIAADLAALEALRVEIGTVGIAEAEEGLAALNAALWDLETAVRACLDRGDSAGFAEAAERIFRLNEARSEAKAGIDRLVHGASAEIKLFEA